MLYDICVVFNILVTKSLWTIKTDRLNKPIYLKHILSSKFKSNGMLYVGEFLLLFPQKI